MKRLPTGSHLALMCRFILMTPGTGESSSVEKIISERLSVKRALISGRAPAMGDVGEDMSADMCNCISRTVSFLEVRSLWSAALPGWVRTLLTSETFLLNDFSASLAA